MSLKLVLATLLITIAFNLNAQSDELVGKWKYKDIYEKEKVDSVGLQMLEMFFSEMTLYFDDDGNYKAFLMGKMEEGKYTLTDDKKTIEFQSDKGMGEEIELIEVFDNELIIKMGNGVFILESVAVSEEDKQSKAPIEIKKQEVTKRQIVGKWALDTEKTASKLTDKQREMFSSLADGNYFEFCKNGTYKVDMFGAENKGKWELGEDNSTIIVRVDESTRTWNVLSASNDELVLLQGDSGEKYFFKR